MVRASLPLRVLGTGLLLGLAACGSGGSSAAPRYSGGSELDAAIPARIASMPLTNQEGKIVHLSDFEGRTIVIQDGMTLCQEQCPIDTATFVNLARASAAQGKNTVFLSITVDPERDTPAQMAAYRALYAPGAGSLPQWQMLTGSSSDIKALWRYFHVWYQKVPQDAVVKNWRTGQRLTYDIQHADEVFFINRSLEQRYLLDGMPTMAGKVPAEIKAFMTTDGLANMRMSGWTVSQGMDVLAWVADH